MRGVSPIEEASRPAARGAVAKGSADKVPSDSSATSGAALYTSPPAVSQGKKSSDTVQTGLQAAEAVLVTVDRAVQAVLAAEAVGVTT